MTVEAIFFDFGGVLLEHADGLDHQEIESRLGVPRGTLYNCLYRDSRYNESFVGKCTRDEWLDSVRTAANRLVGDKAEALLQAFQESDNDLNPKMIDLARRLKQHYRLGIISNTLPQLEKWLQDDFPVLVELMDVRVGSGDLGIAKPAPEIFHHAAREIGVPIENCVFADDMAAYAAAATDLGMSGIHFTDYESFVANLDAIGVTW